MGSALFHNNADHSLPCRFISKAHLKHQLTLPPSGFPGGSDDKEFACHEEDQGLIPGSERSPGEGNGNPLQYSCLENLMDRGAWRATVYGLQESDHD